MKLSRFSLTLLTLVILIAFAGCGEGGLSGLLSSDEPPEETTQEEQPEETLVPGRDDGVLWGASRDDSTDEALAAAIPTAFLVKTVVTRLGKTEPTYQIETSFSIPKNLVIVLQIDYAEEGSKKEIFVMTPGQKISEKFPFGKNIQRVEILPYQTILSLDAQMDPMNAEKGMVNLTRYPVQERRYRVSSHSGQVSR